MHITVSAEIGKDRYDYKTKAKVLLEFEIDDTGANDIVQSLGPLLQGMTKAAIEKYRNPPPDDE